MPYTTQTSDFWGWYLRHNSRVVWSHFQDAGLDLFSSGPSQPTQSFLALTNVLPGISGGFLRRWSLTNLSSHTVTSAYNIVRTFVYSQAQDASNLSNTANTNLWIGTDNQNFYTFTDSGNPFTGMSQPTNFGSAGEITACNSRSYFYYGNSSNNTPARKVNPSYTTANTDSAIGIEAFTPQRVNVLNPVTGFGYTAAPTVTVTDVAGGSGTGATVTAFLDALGQITTFSFTSGSGYTQAQASIAAPPGGGRQGYIVLYTQANPNLPNFGKVVGWDFGGPMVFNGGRTYGIAFKSSFTGHTSDIKLGDGLSISLVSATTGSGLKQLVTGLDASAGANMPAYIASTNGNVQAGTTQIVLQLTINSGALDPQTDTIVLLAGADGQGDSTMYELAQIPLSSFTLSGGLYTYQYLDVMPDSYSDMYTTGNTLLAQDIWSEIDAAGTINGITDNSLPPIGIKYFTTHLGRMFATDGKTLFYSKSLDEVTTSTGLITSKWEECWPGDYQLPLALNNEQIRGIKSDGINLHVGTERSIFTIYGSDPTTFSVPAVSFAEVGILSNDTWTVTYSEGQPSGFVWITPDFKVMHSDFSTYREIGTPIYPALSQLNNTYLQNAKAYALTYGPYDLVVIQAVLNYVFPGQTSMTPTFLLWESRLGKWYVWGLPSLGGGSEVVTIPSSFVYQFPSYTSSGVTPGSKFIYLWDTINNSGTFSINLDYFNPTTTVDDYGAYPISWAVQSSWQDLGDPTAIKVVNEIEALSNEGVLNVTLYGANSQNQFSNPVTLKTGQTVAGPISSLQSTKFYCAGTPTASKYYSILLQPVTPGTDPSVLTSFSIESYPMARI